MVREKKIRFWFVILGVIIIAGIFFLVCWMQIRIREKKSLNVAATPIEETAIFRSSNSAGVATVKTEEEKITPAATLPAPKGPPLGAKFLLDVQFQSQAPYGDWSQPYQDACEEAAIITTLHYYNQKPLSKEVMKSEIDAAAAWQMENWGGHHDLPADQILKLAQDYFSLNGKVIRDYSLDDLKKIIFSGKPIIAPTAGRRLGNPNFRGAGPEYHNIVIIGYDDSQGIFITNDPGTRNGKSYVYKYQTVLSAISGPKENMEKAVVILSK